VVAEAAPPQAPVYEPLPEAGPTLAEQFAAPEEPQAPVVEEELVILSEPEPQPEAPEPEAWSAPEEPQAPEGVATPWHSDETTWSPKTAPSPDFAAPSPDYAASSPRTNGGSGHKTHDFAVASPKSLEDSVKEMLRPMLRKWLDENMQRVLTQALREELEDPEERRRQG
jgi:cell pole-organizing protein PopZ